MTASVEKIAKIRTGTRTESSFCRSSASCRTSQGTCEGAFEVSILNDKFNDKPARIGYNRAGGFCLSS